MKFNKLKIGQKISITKEDKFAKHVMYWNVIYIDKHEKVFILNMGSSIQRLEAEVFEDLKVKLEK